MVRLTEWRDWQTMRSRFPGSERGKEQPNTDRGIKNDDDDGDDKTQ
jgi:hypothetical protein